MGIPVSEQETVIRFGRDEEICDIFTTDSTVITKLDKLASNPAISNWKIKGIHRNRDGEVIGRSYETHKGLISFRKDFMIRNLTEEQKAENAKRLSEARQEKKDRM